MSTFDLENVQQRPGDELRDLVANLLTPRFGRPTREARVAGKKVDLRFEFDDLGKRKTLLVECKDHATSLGRAEVALIWSDYSGIVAQNSPCDFLLITRAGLTSDAESFIRDEISQARHQTIWELENNILGLSDYVRGLQHLFEQNGLNQYYIEARARHATYGAEEGQERQLGEPILLYNEIDRWIDADEEASPIAILGGYGAGKTSLAARVVSFQAKYAMKDPVRRRPLLIRLGSFSRYSSIDGIFGGMFSAEFPIPGFNFNQFMEANARGRFVIVLDGFDEMKHAMTWSDFRSQAIELNRLVTPKSKVLLLGRPSAFLSQDEHLHVLRGR